MLQDADRGLLEFSDQVGRRGDIEDVVIRKFLTLELRKMVVERAVKRGFLVRVFTVS
jgi:hypothetical protein